MIYDILQEFNVSYKSNFSQVLQLKPLKQKSRHSILPYTCFCVPDSISFTLLVSILNNCMGHTFGITIYTEVRVTIGVATIGVPPCSREEAEHMP